MLDFDGRSGPVGVFGVVEESVKLVVFAVSDGVELMRMALGAADGETKPDRAGGVDSVDDGLDAELFTIGSALLVDESVPVEGGGNELAFAPVRKKVTGELFDRELIKG